MVYALNKFFNEGLLPKVNIYVDSPLAVNATDIFRLHTDILNADVAHEMLTNPDPFGFNSLFFSKSPDESKKLNDNKNPCVIISASGMMEAGRIKHLLANNIENPKNTILAVAYCGPRTLGARILEGADEVSIFGIRHPVRPKIERIEAFSVHEDYNEMADFISCQDKTQLKKVFLVHGEYAAQSAYKNTLEQRGFRNIEIPVAGETLDL